MKTTQSSEAEQFNARQEKILEGVHPQLANVLQMEAYDRGHSAGHDEVLGILGWLVSTFNGINVLLKESESKEKVWDVVKSMELGGYWLKLTSPFNKRENWNAGFTPHDTTGWNGRPDFTGTGKTKEEAILEAAKKLVVNTTKE